MTILLLARHGEVKGIDPPTFRGRLDLHLTESGIRQAHALAKAIARVRGVQALFSSPARRCVDTAAFIGKTLDCPVQTLSALQDIDFGAWQGLSYEEVRTRWPQQWQRWRNAPQLASIPQAETLQEALARVSGAMRELLATHHGQTIMVVAHDSINRILLCHLLDISLSHYGSLRQDPCCINRLQIDHDRATLLSLNETGHLPRS